MRAAGVVLAGGRSSRMGAPKAWLDWHGSTLLRRVAGIMARAVDGPVVVVGAPGQPLPSMPAGVRVVADPYDGLGPLQGIATGLTEVGATASSAFMAATDLPFLHPAFIRCVLAHADDETDVVMPVVGGHPQRLAAAYRTRLGAVANVLVETGELRPSLLLERGRVRWLEERVLREDAQVARWDPGLLSVRGVNDPAELERARGVAAPEIVVEGHGAVRAWTLAAAVRAAGQDWTPGMRATVNSGQSLDDGEAPLVAGDVVALAG